MKTVATLAFVLLLAACGSDEAPPPEPNPLLIRDTRAGQVIGYTDGDVSRWRGIPYAAAPVGSLRWRAPQQTPAWDVVRDATQFGSICSQIAHPLSGGDFDRLGELVGSEDCLYLNITAPADADSNELLPVMLWIHGGGNMVGASNFYDFAELARHQRVLVVSVNYRMGLFGWFSHAALRQTAEDTMDAGSNFGLLDIIASLQWVRNNISAFGGDPTRVTIFGESAGGNNVAALLSSRLTRGLYHGAISQSGSSRSYPVAEAEATEPSVSGLRGSGWFVRHWLQRSQAAGGPQSPPAPDADNPAALVKWLRALPAEAVHLTGAWAEPGDEAGGLPPVARVISDGLVIPSHGIAKAFEQGETISVPAIFGTNRDEMKLFFAFDDEMVSNWFGIQYFIRDRGQFERASSYQSRAWKAYGADELAAHHGAPSWVYRFDWDEEPTFLWTDFSELLGASHAFEIPFVSGNFSLGSISSRLFNDQNRPAAVRLSEQMMAHWGTFARSGSPAAVADSPVWPTYRIGHSFMVFDTINDGGLRLEEGRVSLNGLLQELSGDSQVADATERCGLAWGLLQSYPQPLTANVRQYEQWRGGLCKDIKPRYFP